MRLFIIALCAALCAMYLYFISKDVRAIRKSQVCDTLIEISKLTNDSTYLNKADSIINEIEK